MILVLLNKFCESGEFLSEYKLCQVLAKQGQDLFVTSVSTGEALEAETMDAKDLSMKVKGSITLLHPDSSEPEDPQPEWLAKYHKKYFNYLSGLDGVNVIIGTLPGTERTAAELSVTLKSKLILLSSIQIPIDQNLEDLRAAVKQVNEIWSVGNDVHSNNDTIFRNINDVLYRKHKKVVLEPHLVSDLIPSFTFTLAVLPKFSESPDSLLGYQLCLQLVKQGHELYVTTTSIAKRFELESKTAKDVTEKFQGSIKLVQAQGVDLDHPDLHTDSFENLRKLHNVDTVIGLFPLTTRTAVELKHVLNCKLVLLATNKLPEGHNYQREDLEELAKESDEIWSVGPDTYMYYHSLFQDKSKHKEVLLQPTTTVTPYWVLNADKPKSKIKKFVSLWNGGHPKISTGKKVNLNEVILRSYSTVCSALGSINKHGHLKGNIQWNVHGLKYQDATVNGIRFHAKPDEIKLNPLSAINSVDELSWKNQAFIVPDIVDESLNFAALSAIWLGIPTIISSHSALGKFLLNLDCPSKTRAVVILSGNPDADREVWIDKIHKEILDEHANPIGWARQLSEYLQNDPQLWELDLSVLSSDYNDRYRRSSTDTIMSYTTADEKQPGPEVLSKVGTWLQGTEEAIHDQEQVSEAFRHRLCPRHAGWPVSLYCQQCKLAVCGTCVQTQHRGHNNVALEQKDREVKDGLNSLLFACKQQEENISRRTTILSKCERKIEKCASKAIEQMRQRYQLVQQAQLDIFNGEVAVVNQWKENKMKTFQKEASRLEHLYNHQKDIADSGSSLLKHTTSPDFVSQSDTFLTCNHLADLPPPQDTSWNRMLYHQPSYWRIVNSIYFRNHMKEHILGYIAPEMPTTEAAEMPATGPRKGSILPEYSVGDDTHITDFTNMTSMTNMTTRSDIYRHSRTSRYSRKPELSSTANLLRVTAELVSSTHIKLFEGSHLKTFSNALFRGDSIWICGWNKSRFGSLLDKDNVFMNVKRSDFSVLAKQRKGDSIAEAPTMMFSFGDYILYAKKRGSEVFSFHTLVHTFIKRHSSDSLSIAAMCGSDQHVFILNQNELTFIDVLDANLQPEGKIATHLIETEVKGCSFDICLIKSELSDLDLQNKITMDHTIVISSSTPYGSVTAVNQTHGKLWQLDCRSSAKLNLTFNPCSVSSDDEGNIFIADRGQNTIYTISNDGEDLQVLIDRDMGIQKPTTVRVDSEDRRLAVINRNGNEIRIYQIVTNQTSTSNLPSSKMLGNKETSEQIGDSQQLTDSKLLELSKQFVNAIDLREVAINGLEFPIYHVEKHIKGNPTSIHTAAYNLLREWRETQPDRSAAHSKITQALETTHKLYLKQVI